MSIEKLERVMWRVRKNNPDTRRILNSELRKAIMLEIGTSPSTYIQNRKALITLGWIKTRGNKRIMLTNEDLTG